MKKLFVLLITILVFASCDNTPNDYVTISGQINGLEVQDTLLQIRSRSFSKSIKLDATGSFKDTFKIKDADVYSLAASRKVRFSTYLRNGNTLNITGDAKDLKTSLKFEGEGAETNNYLQKRMYAVQEFNNERAEMVKLDSAGFYEKINEFDSNMSGLLKNAGKIDTALHKLETKGLSDFVSSIKSGYVKQQAYQKTLGEGKPSPKFFNYENFKGGKTSLDDLKGRYVYIDVWATWCKPCLNQIPALKELEKEYRGKNIEFVSISTDKPEKHDAWINMIKSKGMSGTQLYAGADQSFQQAYQITSIPRFLFIGPNGEIINANAPRPTQKDAIKSLFTEQGI